MRVVLIGIVGLGPRWEKHYRPALERLGERVRVSAIFDWIYARARLVAEKLGAVPTGGVRSLCRREDVQGVVVLDAAWAGPTLLPLILAEEKPVFVATGVGRDAALLGRLHAQAVSRGMTVMPELGWRYTPASLRLQELMATRLGRAIRINIDLACSTKPAGHGRTLRGEGETGGNSLIGRKQFEPASGAGSSSAGGRSDETMDGCWADWADLLVQWFDLCWYLFRSRPREVWCRAWGNGNAMQLVRRVELRFSGPQSSGQRSDRVAELRIDYQTERPDLRTPAVKSSVHVVCESGEATLDADKFIRWTNGSGQATETLTADRPEVEVMLDHFCRRVAGGLIPVADLNDVRRSLLVAEAAVRSLRENRPLIVNLSD